MTMRSLKLLAPEHLLAVAAQIGTKNIKTPYGSEFTTKVGEDWFFVRGIKAGVSVTYVK